MSRAKRRQKRRSTAADKPAAGDGGDERRRRRASEFNPDYSYVRKDLKRIGILAGFLLSFLIALSFLLN